MFESMAAGLKRLGVVVVCALVVVAGVLTVLGRLGRVHWVFDWMALAHHYYLAFGLVLLLILLWMRRWRWVVGAAVVVVMNGWLLAPYLPTASVAESESERTIRLLVYNMYFANWQLEQAVHDVELYEADIVFIMEYSFHIQEAIESHFSEYEYRLIEPSHGTTGLALFSHIPIAYAEVHQRRETRIPIFEVEFVDGERPFTLVAGHSWPPVPELGEMNRAQMGDITAVAAAAPHPLIVAGDFNASVWSYLVRNLANAAAVADAHRGYWFQPTWQLNPWLQLPLDHIFVSQEWQVLNYQHGGPGGSDHDILVVDLALR